MYTVDKCICCGSSNVDIKSAALAKFVHWRISGSLVDPPPPTQSIKCQDCTYFGSTHRFSSDEVNSLYIDYRGSKYNSMRVICEPEYAAHSQTFDTIKYIKERKKSMDLLINRNLPYFSRILSILDYGGDNGIHIPTGFNAAEKYVYDISNVTPITGVAKFDINSKRTFDFLMCCHVLEHLSNPAEIIINIKRFMHKDSIIYIEVPGYKNPPPENIVFHEHINMFNIQSLTALLNENKITVIDFDNSRQLCILGKLT